jgi:hypothetical protein
MGKLSSLPLVNSPLKAGNDTGRTSLKSRAKGWLLVPIAASGFVRTDSSDNEEE